MVFLIRRLGFYVITAWVAITVNFFIPHLMPGDPAETLIARAGGQLNGQALNALRAQFGLLGNPSLWTQYVRYWKQLFHGNLGISTSSYPESVAGVIASNLPWTLVLVGIATIISFIVGTLIGIIVGWRRGSWLDGVLPVSTFFQAVPYFFFGIIIMIVFADKLHWFPASGGYTEGLVPSWNGAFLTSAIEHSILPGATIVVSSIAGWIVGMRNMMVTTMDEDYVLVAAAKGLPRGRVVAYAARNAILPSISSFALSLSFVVSGALLTEMVFNYPGIGTTLLNAVQAQDYPLLQGIFLVITFAVLAANLLAELVYVVLDPRTRQEG
jgi:peptide/nickel transport system permease protein